MNTVFLFLKPSIIVDNRRSQEAQILNLMMDLQDEMGLTFMFISHDLSVVKHISDDIMVMYLGQAVEKTKANNLFSRPLHPYTQALLNAIPIPSLDSRETKKMLIKGEITSPINPKPGCGFAARCPKVLESCLKITPELKEVEPEHFVSCHLFA